MANIAKSSQEWCGRDVVNDPLAIDETGAGGSEEEIGATGEDIDDLATNTRSELQDFGS